MYRDYYFGWNLHGSRYDRTEHPHLTPGWNPEWQSAARVVPPPFVRTGLVLTLTALASEHGFALYWAQGTIQRGEALIAAGAVLIAPPPG